MFEAILIAGVIAASAILFYVTFRPRKDIRVMARTLVRATEKRGEWDKTIDSEHIKRARVALVLQDSFPHEDPDWVAIIIEEAVFDMEADHEYSKSRSTTDAADQYDRHVPRPDGDESGTSGVNDDGDRIDVGDRPTGDGVSTTGWPGYETEPEDLEIPVAE